MPFYKCKYRLYSLSEEGELNTLLIGRLRDQFVPPYIQEKKKKGKENRFSVHFHDSDDDDDHNNNNTKKRGTTGKNGGIPNQPVTQGCACIIM